jgi:hypothetical protein
MTVPLDFVWDEVDVVSAKEHPSFNVVFKRTAGRNKCKGRPRRVSHPPNYLQQRHQFVVNKPKTQKDHPPMDQQSLKLSHGRRTV